MICSNCGNELEDDAMFCTNCGMKLADAGTIPVVPDTINMSGMNENPEEAGGVSKIKMPKKPDFSQMPKFEEIIKDKKKRLVAAVPAGAVFLLLIILLVVKIAGGGNKVRIDAFRGYKWGTPYDVVYNENVTDDMYEYDDYREVAETGLDNVEILRMYDGSVGGYDTVINYVFKNGKLVAGGYSLHDSDDAEYLIPRYKEVYGEPIVEKTVGDKKVYFWKDKNNNYILFSGHKIAYLIDDEVLVEDMHFEDYDIDPKHPERS